MLCRANDYCAFESERHVVTVFKSRSWTSRCSNCRPQSELVISSRMLSRWLLQSFPSVVIRSETHRFSSICSARAFWEAHCTLAATLARHSRSVGKLKINLFYSAWSFFTGDDNKSTVTNTNHKLNLKCRVASTDRETDGSDDDYDDDDDAVHSKMHRAILWRKWIILSVNFRMANW